MLQAPAIHRYDRLLAILERYISRSTVSAMLRTVVAERGLAPDRMTADELVALVEEVMIGLRLFCSPRRLPDLMLELADLCDQEMSEEEAAASSPQASGARPAQSAKPI
ncbi:MAG TPA: hypothetical protein VLS89_15800 [Candidatus Nanopelagicales bacterium]|nr:hypothetical protein [Candidatus Nanopelagicales bacterium]